MNTEQILFIIIRAIIPLPTSGGEMVTSLWCGYGQSEKWRVEIEMNIREDEERSFVIVKVMLIIYHSLDGSCLI